MARLNNPEPIAIVGMGCRWAGGVRDTTGLWEFLINKRSGYQDWAEPRFSAKGFYHPNPERPGTTAAKGGYVVTEDPRLFDPAFFGISGLEAETIDPSQRKLLEVVYEALENAGETWESINGTRTGVYVADISYDNSYAQTRDWEYARPHATTGVSHNILSNRINYVFNLTGPSVTLDSACTSALYGLHMAIQAIRDGDCDSAIVATSNYIMDPSMQIAMDKLGALSGTSMSHAFDASADGYARGEGFAAIYLKKPGKAMEDGSPIRALVRGSAIGANGRSSGITHPSGVAQEAIIRKAYENAGDLPPSETPFLECHGTGTRVGDPLEVEAAGKVFGPGRSNAEEDRLLIGSIKTSLGHTEGAAALAGIFKAVLALEAGVIPPSVGVQTLNPRIDFDKAKASVVTEVIPWPRGKLRRASVTSAGFGGSLGHCILDHVNIYYPDYVKPGIFSTRRTSSSLRAGMFFKNETNGSTTDVTDSNGGINGGINGDSNGHDSVSSNGHVNRPSNGCNGTTEYESNEARSNGENSNGHNANFSKSTSTYNDGNRNGTGIITHHPIIESPKTIKKADATTREYVVLPFAANNESSLKANIASLAKVINHHSLADIAYTLGVRRSKLPQRTFRVVGVNDAANGLLLDTQKNFTSPQEAPKLAFIFTGQGAQWHAMGAQLFDYRTFRNTIKYLDTVIAQLPGAPSWRIFDILTGSCEIERVQDPEVSQTVCTAVQVGLVDVLASWSIRPSGVVGHSSGEMAAAYAAGRITAAESIAAAFYRGQAVTLNKQKGGMLAVSLTVEQAIDHLLGLEQEIKIAAINSPDSLTLSGDLEAVERLSETLTQKGIFNRLLKTGGNAYHSHHMVRLGEEYDALLANGLRSLAVQDTSEVHDCYAAIPWVSSVTPDKILPLRDIPTSYWRANLESPVRFSDAVANLIKQVGIGALVEIGPHPALRSPLDQILKSIGKPLPYAGSLKRGEDSRRSLLQLAGTLFGLNAEIDFAVVNATDEADGICVFGHGTMATDLPPYQFTYGPISYYESRASKEYRLRGVPRHDLIGSKIPGNAKLRPQFRNVLRMKDLPWLGDHRLLPDVVFPAAGYICMAMVAASQLYQEHEGALPVIGHSLRNVNIRTALKIPEDQHGIEVILSMEVSDHSTSQKPAWISFSVSSVGRDSEQWTEHCTGMVKVDVNDFTTLMKSKKIDTEIDSRFVETRGWYKTFSTIGLGYGPAFQALSEIRADPTKNIAIAKLGLKTTSGIVKGGESNYPIHPASLDAMIQLGLLASHGGQTDRATTAYVPIHLSEMRLRSGIDQEWSTAIARGEFRGLRSAYLQLQLQNHAGDLFLNISDLRCISYSLESHSAYQRNNTFASPFTRMVYRPDFRTLSKHQARALFPPPKQNLVHVAHLNKLQTIASLAALEINETLLTNSYDVSGLPRNIAGYVVLIRKIAEKSKEDSINKIYTQPLADRQQLLENLYQNTTHLIEVQAIKRLHQNIAHIVKQEKTGEEILAEGGLLADFFVNSLLLTGARPQLANVLDLLSHANPNLKILEMKGGSGDTAHCALKALSNFKGIKRYQSYTITDLSEAALQSVQKQLVDYKDIHFSVLDFEKDPLEQNYEPIYDIVLASQVIHTASSVTLALDNARKLLRPGGRLILIETTGCSDWIKLIGGAQAGYWHSVPDGRFDSPFRDVSGWHAALRSSGFSGVDIVLDDYPEPVLQSSVIVATRIEYENVQESLSKTKNEAPPVYLLHGRTGPPPLLKQLAQEIEDRGSRTNTLPFDDAPRELSKGTNARIIAFLDNTNLLLDVNQDRLQIFQYLAHHTQSMVLLTSTGIAQGHNPNGAVVGGLLRTISTEAPTGRFFSVDIDADNFNFVIEAEALDFVRVLADQEQALQKPHDGEASEDREFSWHSGNMWVSRLLPEPALQGYAERLSTPTTHSAEILPIDSQGPVRAAFETAGILSSLYFRPYTELRQQTLPTDWIEVKVAAVGLNWKDLVLSAGRFDDNNLSSEYAGIVTQVGDGVANRFAVGDPVYGLGKGHFGNFTRVPAALAQKAHPDDDLVHMATMPVVFMTAVYAFEHLTRLRPGQKVLIQSASGGVGLGAIQLARAKGADVFAMAGTPEKRDFLVDSVGLPRSNVFAANDLNDIARAIDTTKTGGFDVILSTASGDMLYETMKALAPLGHLIDIGRMNVEDAKAIGLELFQKSASFSSFDMYRVVERDTKLGASLIRAVGDHYRAGHIGHIRPLTTSDISQLDQTLLAFSKGKHVGKYVVTFQDPESKVKMVRSPPVVRFDPEACYVITGGLSGLGRSIIQWMGNRGARDIVILSRRGRSAPEAQSLVTTLAERGITIHPTACDLSSQEDVIKAINQAGNIKPVKGIVHCAVSYQDISFDKVTAQGWRDGLAAKVQGTQNLHEATKNIPLDFFVMTTSILSVLSFATQSAYTAANNFQDHFARYRRRLGLPATAAQFGLVNDVGHHSTDTVTLDLMARNKAMTLPESYFLRLLEPAFLNHDIQVPHDPLAAATYVTCMDPAHMAEKEQEYSERDLRSATTPRWYGDARVSHVIRGFEDALRHDASDEGRAEDDAGQSPTAKLRREFEEIKHKAHMTPAGAEKVEYRTRALEKVTAAIVDTVAAMLLLDLSAVSTSRAVIDHGIDSLIAAELRNWFYVALGAKISMVDLLDPRTSIASLAAKIVDSD